MMMMMMMMMILLLLEESEKMAAKMKGLDKPLTSKTTSSTSAAAAAAVGRPHKDINTFVNNQLKFTSASPNSIPPDQMKCNILKAVSEERSKRGVTISAYKGKLVKVVYSC